MTGWPPWPTSDLVGLARYVATHADRLLPGIDRYTLAAGAEGPIAVARAIYELLLERHISYDVDSYHPSEVLQDIRSPAEVLLAPRRATCLDAALLYAALVKAYELLPVVVVLDGHALTLVSRRYGLREWNTRAGSDRLRSGPVTDPDVIRELVRSGDFAAVECTGFTRVSSDPTGRLSLLQRVDGYLSFDAALAAGFAALTGGTWRPRSAVDIAAAHFDLRIQPYEVEPSALTVAEAELDQWVVGHDEMLRDLRERPRHLLSSQLGFVTPGKDHPAAPANILRRLTESTHPGVLLTGPAGTGKTRTCIEVAILAHREGWRVLHIRGDSRLRNEHLQAAVLRDPAARTLLVLDYLDLCGGLDIPQFVARMMPRVAQESGRLAIVGSARPAQLGRLLGGDGQEVLHPVGLRNDDEHRDKVASRILRQVARKALVAMGRDSLIEICGRLPIITLLIAQDVEHSVRHREPVQAGAERGRLTRWLHSRLVRDGLIPVPDETAPPTPFDEREPRPVLLACTLAAAACPLPQQDVEELIQPVLDTATPRVRARTLINTLCGMGWLERTNDTLKAAHHIITDQFLVEAVAPPTDVRVLDTELRLLLDALLRAPAGLDHTAAGLARIYADIAPSDRAGQLQRACGEWIDEHASALGEMFAQSADGGHALYTMLHSAPWQGLVSEQWNAMVEPWLRKELRDSDRAAFLSYSLRKVRPSQATPTVTAALVWLAGHRDNADAEIVLGPLLQRKDLREDQRVLAVEHALAWLERFSDSTDATFVLRGLLAATREDGQYAEKVLGSTIAWLTDRPTRPTADVVLNQLLSHPHLKGEPAQTAIGYALTWTQRFVSGWRAPYALRPLLERTDLSGQQRSEVVDVTLRWIGRHPTAGAVSFVLPHLLIWADRTGDARRAEIVAAADVWLASNETEPAASFVLPHLLSGSTVSGTAAVQRVRQALRWLAVEHDDVGTSYVLRAMLSVLHSGLGAELLTGAVTAALRWLVDDPDRPGAGHVLAVLIRSTVLTTTQVSDIRGIGISWLRRYGSDPGADWLVGALMADRAYPDGAEIGLAWAEAHPDHPAVGKVIRDLLANPAAARDRAADLCLTWAEADPDDPLMARILVDLLASPGHADRAAEIGFVWVDTHADRAWVNDLLGALLIRVAGQAADPGFAWLWARPDHPSIRHALKVLLADPACQDKDRARELGVAWVRAHPDHPSASYALRLLLAGPKHGDSEPIAQLAFDWIHAHPADPALTRILRSLLVAYPDQAHRAAQVAFDRIADHPDDPAVRNTLQVLLAHTDHLDRAAHVALDWIQSHGDHATAHHLLRALLAEPAYSRRAGELALEWVRAQPDHPGLSLMLQALLAEPDCSQRAGELALAWVRTHPDDPGLTFMLEALLAEPDCSQRAGELALAWVRTHPDDPGVSGMLQTLLAVPTYAQQAAELAVSWIGSNHDHATIGYVFQALFAQPYRVDHVAELAFTWAHTHLDHHAVGFVFQALLAQPGRDGPAAELAFTWIDNHHDHPGVSHLLKELLDDPAQVDRAAAVGLAWVQTHPDIVTVSHLLPSLLAHAPNSDRATELGFAWLESHADAATIGHVLQGLLAKPAHAERAAEFGFAWLESHDGHDAAAAVLRALVEANRVPRTVVQRAADVAFGWLDHHAGHPEVNVIIRTLLGASEIGLDRQDWAAHAAFAWLAANPAHPNVNHMVRALLGSRHLDTQRRHEAAVIGLDWLDANFLRDDSSLLIRALLARNPYESREVAVALTAALAGLQTHPDAVVAAAVRGLRADGRRRSQTAERAAATAFARLHTRTGQPELKPLIVALLNSVDLSASSARRAADIAAAWLDAHPHDRDAATVTGALLENSSLPAEYARRAADVAVRWLSEHGARKPGSSFGPFPADGGQSAPFSMDSDLDDPLITVLVQRLLASESLGEHYVEPAANMCLAWLEDHPESGAAHHVIGALLVNRSLHQARSVRAVEAAFRWLEANRTNARAVYLLPALFGCRNVGPEYRERALDAAFTWLDGGPAEVHSRTVIRALLATPDLHGDHLDWAGAAAVRWVEDNSYHTAVDSILEALIGNPRLDPEYTAWAARTWLSARL